MNCYEILEVSQNASPEVIKAAYKSLMQRYHPDKNPDNAEVAAHALNVVQAYELLSDVGRRAAYDISLKQQLAVGLQAGRNENAGVRTSLVTNGLQWKHDRLSYGILWILITLIILVSLTVMYQLNGGQRAEMSRISLPKPDAIVSLNEAVPKTIPVFISNLTVEINGAGGLPGDTTRVLTIPTLGLKVGAFDADNVLRYIENNKEQIRQNLEQKLVYAKYDDLIKLDGEQYLKDLVKDSIANSTGIPRSEETVEQYGVVDILLPRSFSVN
jgi:hypothetical protein